MSDQHVLQTLVQTQGEVVGISQEVVKKVVKAFEANSAITNLVENISHKDCLNVWRERGEWMAERNGPVQGYPALIGEMEASSEVAFDIVKVKNREAEFLLFVNLSHDKLVGILYYPLREVIAFGEREKQRIKQQKHP